MLNQEPRTRLKKGKIQVLAVVLRINSLGSPCTRQRGTLTAGEHGNAGDGKPDNLRREPTISRDRWRTTDEILELTAKVLKVDTQWTEDSTSLDEESHSYDDGSSPLRYLVFRRGEHCGRVSQRAYLLLRTKYATSTTSRPIVDKRCERLGRAGDSWTIDRAIIINLGG